MAWDEYFMKGLQTGLDMAIKKKTLQAEAEFRKYQQEYNEQKMAQDFAAQTALEKYRGQQIGLDQQRLATDRQKIMFEQGFKTKQLNAFMNQFSGKESGGGLTAGVVGEDAQYIKVPDYNSPTGFRMEINPNWKAKEAAKIKGEAKTREAQQKATSNFGRVATAVKQFSEYYAKSLDEGGTGNWGKEKLGYLATQKIGGQLGEQMTGTGKLFGQRAELSLAMVPILTNQNRFMSSIMDYINKSLPQGAEGAKLASSKLEQTLLNQYTTSKVLIKLGFDPDKPEDVAKLDEMGDEEAGGLAKKVISMSRVYKLSEEEQKEYDEIKKDVLGSLTNYKSKTKTKTFKSLWE